MIEAFPLIIVLTVIVLVQLGLIYGLVNRILRQNGLPRLNPGESLELKDKHPDNGPVAKPKVIAGSQRIGI